MDDSAETTRAMESPEEERVSCVVQIGSCIFQIGNTTVPRLVETFNQVLHKPPGSRPPLIFTHPDGHTQSVVDLNAAGVVVHVQPLDVYRQTRPAPQSAAALRLGEVG